MFFLLEESTVLYFTSCTQHPYNTRGVLSFLSLQVFIWIGKDANETERQESVKSGKSNQFGRFLSEVASILLNKEENMM